MQSPDWLIERGIGETRAVIVDQGAIVEARIIPDGSIPAGTVIDGRLSSIGVNGRNAVVTDEDGQEYLLPRGAGKTPQGAVTIIEITREVIPGAEPWKRPLARLSDQPACPAPPLTGTELPFPAARDELSSLGWNELLEEARSGIVRFEGGELRIAATPAMALIDVDGFLAPEQLALRGAQEAAKAIRRLDIGGSIGIDLPTSGSKAARLEAATAIDASLPHPFERTAVNGFGFIQIVRPRPRPSLIELAQDRAGFEARALLRRVTFEPAGAKRLVAHPSLIAILEKRGEWLDQLSRQVGGVVELRADASLPISGAYAEPL